MQTARDEAGVVAHIPLVGVHMMEEQLFVEMERICQEKGILPVVVEQ